MKPTAAKPQQPQSKFQKKTSGSLVQGILSLQGLLSPYKLLSSTGFKQTIYSSAGYLAASALAALATILITRKLGPTDFGRFSTAFSLALILIKLNDLGLSTATTKFLSSSETKKMKAQFYLVISAARFVLSLVLISAGLILFQPLSQTLQISPYLTLSVFFMSLATVYFEHLQLTLQAQHRFKTTAAVTIVQAAFKLAFAVSLYLTLIPTDPVFIFVLYMISPGIPAALTQWLIPRWLEKFDWKLAKLAVSRVGKLTAHSAISVLSIGVVENVDVLFVKAYLNDYQAGLLGGVSRITLLLYVTAFAIGSVLNARVAHYQTKHDLDRYWRKAAAIAAAALAGFLISIPLARPLLTLTIGPEYLPALPIMIILLGSGFATIAAVPFGALFYTFDLPWYFSVVGIVQLLLILLGNGLLVPLYGLSAAAWTRFITRLVLLILTVTIARWYYQQNYVEEN